MKINLEMMWQITPRALNVYKAIFAKYDLHLNGYGILKTELRLSHFLAQVLHETNGLTVLVENLNYSAERLMEVWPSRFHTIGAARAFEHSRVDLANYVYGNRMGNVQPGDGWKFVGRGLLQLTGRDSYDTIGRGLGIDLVDNPNLALTPEYGLLVAAEIWKSANCNTYADKDDIRAVTRAINGGYIGLTSRRQWLTKARNIVRLNDAMVV